MLSVSEGTYCSFSEERVLNTEMAGRGWLDVDDGCKQGDKKRWQWDT